MSVVARIALVTLLAFSVTMAVMTVVSQRPGMALPLGWWIVGAILPIAITVPVAFWYARQAQSVRRLNDELLSAYAAVKRASETDHLTGIANRAAFWAAAESRHQRRGGWFLVIDIDHFKRVNDCNSHAHGDLALVTVAATLRAVIGPGDVVGRIGGEEFAIFLAGGGAGGALAIAEAIRAGVAALMVAGADGAPIGLTVSIGLAGGAGRTVANGLSAADRAMYRAKQDGRDRVVFLRDGVEATADGTAQETMV